MSSNKAPARGRKRFAFDLKNAIQSVSQGVEVRGVRLSVTLISFLAVSLGDEDGSFDCLISQVDGPFKAALTILVSDASEYPSDHTFFCSSHQELPSEILAITESVYEEGSATIQALLVRLLERIARAVVEGTDAVHNATSDDEQQDADSEDEDEDYEMDEYDLELFDVQPSAQILDRFALQRDFNEIVAHGFCPGFIRIGVDEFALTVSLPAKSLADIISPHALLAWDRQLLTGPQYLTLLISGTRGVYPVVKADGRLTHSAAARSTVLQFRVGLTPNYKPDKDITVELMRRYGLQDGDSDKQLSEDASDDDEIEDVDALDDLSSDEGEVNEIEEETEEQARSAGFRPFSLSSSLESLLNGHFLHLLQLRLDYGLGWAGAEVLRWEIESSQSRAEDILLHKEREIRQADKADAKLSESYHLPADCLLDVNPHNPVNLPLIAFSYMLRRLTLCPRYCLVCHQELKEDLDALKPYVCSSTLCTYQYYNLNRGPSLEYEICSNPAAVDLLVSLAYIAAAEGALDAPLPVGMGIRVKSKHSKTKLSTGQDDDLCDLDSLEIDQLLQMRAAIRDLIDMIPPIMQLKRHLEQPHKPGRAKPRLQDIDRSIPEAVWLILRWCVASCTAHLEELKSDEEKVKNMDPTWRQFRFSVGAPHAEAKFRKAVESAKLKNPRAREFPTLYAFHGSPAKNWHSIIRHGLWFKTVANGRAYGNGVYFAKEGSVSLGSYAASATVCWQNSACKAAVCVALAEIVNLPSMFVSTSPFFVVNQTEWIVCRYLMVRAVTSNSNNYIMRTIGASAAPSGTVPVTQETTDADEIPCVPLDPHHPLTLSNALIRIPEPRFALEKLLAARRDAFVPAQFDEEDARIFSGVGDPDAALEGADSVEEAVDRSMVKDDWKHDPEWVNECIEHVLPPPRESSRMASTALQKELQAMLKEQNASRSLKELGWYLPEEFIGDNLYQWIVELHSFDSSLPIAEDLANKKVNSLVFEIRFPATFPHSPPFFRILKPRFLPFIQGGGGHVTGGGSMCMDLLTADGWLPSYSISAILLQIKLAISNLEPRPARLAQNWSTAYGMYEALEGYKRAANTHGWKVPSDIDKLTR
ncbi:hypothetical protein PYCCODRAFT_1446686 [Trametes coccinea BRFM310]|uniref:UBC core domain-containing protein n=1 Tax=Trametes coccinea (strain BRFM310) TaxID=1353009 RepID=A0A1Y2IEK6_TRAC3|nr:hypothetical protein PYCCODRAFT_1446686 [Trametes coccinea BRFM310]